MSFSEDKKPSPRILKVVENSLKTIHFVGMVFVLLMMLLTTLHAIGRYILGLPVPGLVELSSYMLVTMIFLTAPYTALVKGHITISVIVDRFSLRTQVIIDAIVYMLCLALCIIAAWQTFVRGLFIMEEKQVSTILSIPNAPFILLVGAGWSLFSLAILVHIIESVSRAIEK